MTKPLVIEPALHQDLTPPWKVVATKALGKRVVVELWETVDEEDQVREIQECALAVRGDQEAIIATFTATSQLPAQEVKAALLALYTKIDLWSVARERDARALPQDDRPEILVDSDIAPPTDALEGVLSEAKELGIYQRGRYICEIQQAGPAPKWLHRPPDLPRIALSTTTHLRELASKVACFDLVHPTTGKITRGLPPLWLIETLVARKKWVFPPIEGVVNIPTLRPDGSLLVQEGYDPDTGLYLDYNGVVFPPVPAAPSKEEAQDAVAVLWEVFQDFLYADEAIGFSATLAALLSCVCRYAILGLVPMFTVRSTTQASGKGKLIDVISLIALGRTAPRMAQTLDEEEERKRLLAIALAALPLLHIDNVNHPLGSGVLDYALTSPTIGDRLLGKSEDAEAPLNTVFFASGNNLVFKGDTARRVIPIDLDPKQEHPELRTDFVHDNLEAWVTAQRPQLVQACLTIMCGFFANTQEARKPLPAFGSFEAWSAIIRQALVWVEQADPCEARINIESTSNLLYEKRDTLLRSWCACYKDGPGKLDCALTPRTLNSVVQDIQQRASGTPPNDWDAFRDALGALDPRYDGKTLNKDRIGKALRDMRGMVLNDRGLIADSQKDRSGAVQWKVESFSRPLSAEDAEVRRGSLKRTRARNEKKYKEKNENPLDARVQHPLQSSASSADGGSVADVQRMREPGEEDPDDLPF